ncbi:hypothetical protein JNB11_01225 [Kocuria palustris]|nr:hypothetical protein [Kocuria palustris]
MAPARAPPIPFDSPLAAIVAHCRALRRSLPSLASYRSGPIARKSCCRRRRAAFVKQ